MRTELNNEKAFNQIKVTRQSQGRTQKWLCEQSDVTVPTMRRYEKNTKQPDLNTLFKIAAALNVPVCDLLVSENPYSNQSE